MKKLIITCVLLTSASMFSFAQSTQTAAPSGAQPNANQVMPNNRPTNEQRAERMTQTYKQRLNLDDKQYKDVYNVELEFVKEMMDLRAKGGQPGAPEGRKLQAARDEKLKAVLSPEQYQKYAGRSNPQMQQGAPNTAPANK